MDAEPRAIEQQIESTREGLGADVDALADRISPSRIVERNVAGAKSAVMGAKDRVMGSAGSAVTDIREGGSGAVSALDRRARGNPLAAGLIAFGVGWLVASLIPGTEKETELSRAAEEQAKERLGPVQDAIKQDVQEVASNLKQPAQDALDAVKADAADAVQAVKDESTSAASDLGDRTMSGQEQGGSAPRSTDGATTYSGGPSAM